MILDNLAVPRPHHVLRLGWTLLLILGWAIGLSYLPRAHGQGPKLRSKVFLEDDTSLTALAISPDGTVLAGGGLSLIGGLDGGKVVGSFLHLWAPASGKLLHKLDLNSRPVYCLAISTDGKALAVACGTAVEFWDTTTGKQRAVWDLGSPCRCLAFAPDNKTLAVGTTAARGPGDPIDRTGLWRLGNGVVSLRDLGSGREVASLEKFTGPVWFLAFERDGKTLFSVGREVKVWDVDARRELRSFAQQQSIPVSVAVSPQRDILAVADGSDAVQLWDTATAKQRGTLKGHTRGSHAVAFSADGTVLATGGKDAIRLWDVARQKEIHVLKATSSGYGPLLFSPNGKLFIAAGGEEKPFSFSSFVMLWDL